MQGEEANGVKIIELNSSTDSSKDSNKNCGHSWSYASNDKFKEDEDSYNVNEEARRRRRVQVNENEDFAAAYYSYYDQDMQPNSNNFYETCDTDYGSAPKHHHVNCFSIINNHYLKSDSSTDNENFEGIEVIELDNTEGTKNWDHMHHDNVITYDPHMQHETRTIWIYSYKNKRLLLDNDYELVNIPINDASNTSVSYSISDEELKVDKSTTSRLGSPIPAAYVPRLDLSMVQTLSTVTEVSEHNKSFSKESSREVINLKPRNNWLTERNNNLKRIENSNVVNWMALSPRERRRRSINTKSKIASVQNVMEREITYKELNRQFELSNKSSKVKASILQVQADIHANEHESSQEMLTRTYTVNESKESGEKIADTLPIKISFADADNDIEDDNPRLIYSNRPSIDISNKLNKSEITYPIDNLDCSDWISEEKIEKETTVYDYDIETVKGNVTTPSSSENVMQDSANTRLWMRNLQLMKPVHWAEYLPITCSPPSLHLSLSLGSLNGKKSWFKRLTKCVKCCK